MKMKGYVMTRLNNKVDSEGHKPMEVGAPESHSEQAEVSSEEKSQQVRTEWHNTPYVCRSLSGGTSGR